MMPNDCQMYQTKSFPSSCPNQKHPCTSGRGSCTLEGTSPCLPSKSISQCTSPSRALWILCTFSGSEACSSLSSSKICEALKVETNLKHRKEKMHCSIVVKWIQMIDLEKLSWWLNQAPVELCCKQRTLMKEGSSHNSSTLASNFAKTGLKFKHHTIVVLHDSASMKSTRKRSNVFKKRYLLVPSPSHVASVLQSTGRSLQSQHVTVSTVTVLKFKRTVGDSGRARQRRQHSECYSIASRRLQTRTGGRLNLFYLAQEVNRILSKAQSRQSCFSRIDFRFSRSLFWGAGYFCVMLHIEWHNLLSSSSNAMCGEPKRISSRIDAQLVITPPPTWEGRWRQRSSPFALWTPPTRQSSHDWHMNHSTLNKSCGMLPELVSSPISPAMLRMYSWPWTHKHLDKCCKSVQTALRLSSYPFQYPIILLEQIKGKLFVLLPLLDASKSTIRHDFTSESWDRTPTCQPLFGTFQPVFQCLSWPWRVGKWKEPYGHIGPGHKANSHVGIIDNGHTKVAAPLFALSLTESKGHPQKTASSR